MAEYKKKNVKKVKAVKPRKSAVSENYKITPFKDIDDEISVKSAKDAKAERRFEKKKEKYLNKAKPEKRVVYSNKTPAELNRSSGIQVLSGSKNSKKIKRLSALISAILIIGSVLLVQLLSPTGISDLIRNSFLTLGAGTGFPKSVNGSTVKDVYYINGAIATVTDTYIEIYSESGKEVLSLQHGHTSPEVCISANRILLYDKYNQFVSLFDFSGMLFSREIEGKISSAFIGRNGTFGIITQPGDCASELTVFDKNNKQLLAYKSANDLLGSAAVSDSGKYISVVGINASSGDFVSKIKVFKSNSNKVISESEIKGLVISINSFGRSKFVATQSNKMYSVAAKNAQITEITENELIQSRFFNSNNVLLVRGADSNLDASNVKVINRSGKTVLDCNIISNPDKVQYNDEYLAAAKGSIIYVYNKESKKVYSTDCGADASKFVLVKNKLYVACNENILEYKITVKEK